MTSDDIYSQEKLLAVHRRTLAYLVQQAAVHGGEALVPPQIRAGIDQARSEIERIKLWLRAQGVAVADEFSDTPAPPLLPTPPTSPADTSRRTQRRLLIIAIIGGPLAILTGIVSNAIALPEQLRPYALPLLFVLMVAGIGIGVWQWRIEASSTSYDARQAQRNREAMLQKVRQTWIDGVLRQSLYDQVRLDLGMRTNPAGIEQPWRGLVQELDGTPEALPAGTRASQVFDRYHGTLLILGAPGGGKTTLLLELTNTLLDRAQRDPLHPIPVVFPLSTWAARPRPVTQWLRDELQNRYQVPRAVAQTWLDSDQVLPLLDGLDEVAAPQRAACVAAINTFRREHGLLPLVVSSRVAEYTQLRNDETRLQLDGAIILEALTRTEVQKYLADVAGALDSVQAALDADPRHWLWKFAINPLMLSIIALAYSGTAAATLHAAATPELQQRQLFDAYTAAMFKRHTVGTRYSETQTRHWLAQLAAQLVGQDQTVFLIENLQPTWLHGRTRRWGYWLVDRLLAIIVCALVFGLVSVLANGRVDTLVSGLVSGLICGLLLGLFGGIAGLYPGISRRFKDQLRDTLLGGLIGGFVFGAICVLVFGSLLGPLTGMAGGLVGGLIYGLVGGLVGRPNLARRTVVNVETLDYSLRRVFPGVLRGVAFGAIVGLISSGLVVVLGVAVVLGVVQSFLLGLGFGLVFGLVFGLIFGLLSGFQGSTLTLKTQPNQGVRRSLRNAITIYVPVLLIVAIIAIPLFTNTFFFSSFLALPFAFAYGGYAVCSHLALRLVLWRARVLPWNVARFLDYGVERIFLRRVGGGYIFIHRTVMEYFAQMALTPAPRPRTGEGQG